MDSDVEAMPTGGSSAFERKPWLDGRAETAAWVRHDRPDRAKEQSMVKDDGPSGFAEV